jgi:DNA-binding transcriptional ArsR family regulator
MDGLINSAEYSSASVSWDVVSEMRRATTLLHPLRLQILESLGEPESASGLARRLLLAPQKVNYHLRKLERARFVKCVGQRHLGSKTERRYVKTALSYVLSPELLGSLGIRKGAEDCRGLTQLVAMLAAAQAQIAGIIRETTENTEPGGESTSIDLCFSHSEQHAQFIEDVRDAVAAAAARHSLPYREPNGRDSDSPRYRLMLASYPLSSSSGKKTNGKPVAMQPRPMVSGSVRAPKKTFIGSKAKVKRQVPAGVHRPSTAPSAAH